MSMAVKTVTSQRLRPCSRYQSSSCCGFGDLFSLNDLEVRKKIRILIHPRANLPPKKSASERTAALNEHGIQSTSKREHTQPNSPPKTANQTPGRWYVEAKSRKTASEVDLNVLMKEGLVFFCSQLSTISEPFGELADARYTCVRR